MKKPLLSLFVIVSIGLSMHAQEQCGTMQHLEEMMAKDPSLKARMEKIEEETQNWLKNNEQSRIKYVKPAQEALKPKSITPSTLSMCAYDNTWIRDINAPTTVGQKVTPIPNCINGGQFVTVKGLVGGNTYRISTCGSSFDTQLSVYLPDWGGIAMAHNDDYCGLQSEIYYNPKTSGDYHILVDAFDCQSNSTCALLEVELIKTPRPVIRIPVVFHVIHNGEAVGSGTNLSDNLLMAQLATLNQDFRRINSGWNSIPAAFKGGSDDPLIEFCLAIKDPNGNNTTGITRTQGPSSGPYSQGAFDANVKPNTIWDRDKYLNIWTCNVLNIAGYSSFPGEPANVDGVALDYTFVGSGFHMAATHEVGHYLNLRHIWGDESACGADDFVDDTPKQAANTTDNTCPTFPKMDACATKYPGTMFYNFMDYSGNACLSMFTVGQAARMEACLLTTRVALLSSNGCGVSTTDIANYDLSNSVSVYPNPTSGTFSISTKGENEKMNLSIMNILGEKVFETRTSEKEIKIDLQNQSNGIYFLQMNTEQGNTTQKIIIRK